MRRVLLLLLVVSVEGRRVRDQHTHTPESFPLDFTAVEGNVEGFMAQVKSLAQSLYPCSSQRLEHQMKLQILKNSSVTCNDGTPAGYYIKESRGSRRWLVFLEGGWYCFSKHTCDSRYESMRRLMSSSNWPPTRTGTGILSPQPEENPHWWNANTVFVPYCSSDVWSGSTPKTDQNDYAFMGSLIIQEVIKELLTKGLDGAKVLLLAGSSAGGTGVLLNLDRVYARLQAEGVFSVQVRGLVDSGWFLDHQQISGGDCRHTLSCAPTDAIRRGVRYWHSVVPERCSRAHDGQDWNCFFGYKVQPTIQSPVFVVQWLFDEAQLTVDNIHLTGQKLQESQWRYIQNLATTLRNTLANVTAMFAPACLSHEIITRSYWTDVHVKGTSLPRALQCWDRSLRHHGNSSAQAPPRGCPLQLIDSCPWPHCNPSCPSVREQQMSAVQFLTQLGFDIQRMAQQQGIEPNTLLGMLNNGT
ncbi:inactive palmitoleoyl-protein carboxylesterase notum1b precursor [Danio rerio]|uniref:Inactive palmitoleoyl-protein carboxylesterase notum1b precursor n=1 Tax=Danio rerio TaxID=7955 RepID=A0AB13AA02_DANRE|nr:inactive palmitoleoyl-protein carboxylesterase notum1b precursor [Danio rerio]UIC71721.1 notum1b [Danio rerio]